MTCPYAKYKFVSSCYVGFVCCDLANSHHKKCINVLIVGSCCYKSLFICEFRRQHCIPLSRIKTPKKFASNRISHYKIRRQHFGTTNGMHSILTLFHKFSSQFFRIFYIILLVREKTFYGILSTFIHL